MGGFVTAVVIAGRLTVRPGSYRLVAGSDHDRDGAICEPGDFCGDFPSLDAPSPVAVGAGELVDLDFALTPLGPGSPPPL